MYENNYSFNSISLADNSICDKIKLPPQGELIMGIDLHQNKKQFITGIFALFSTLASHAAIITSEIFATNGTSLGKVSFEDSKYGLLIKPLLSGLPAGLHGFHIHQNPSCGDGGMSAGGHFDPANTNTHQGPYGEGHLGDLPILTVSNNGEANILMLAPRLKTENIHGHALMIHAGGDNYSDTPPLGGGGARIGCGKIS